MKSINFAENNNVVRNANIERLRVEINAYERLSDTDLRSVSRLHRTAHREQRTRQYVQISASFGLLLHRMAVLTNSRTSTKMVRMVFARQSKHSMFHVEQLSLLGRLN